MHHEAVKSNLCGSSKGYECDHQPLCPRPRKLSPAIPDFLKPHRCTTHRFIYIYLLTHTSYLISYKIYLYMLLIWFSFSTRSHPDAKEEESGILSMITEKVQAYILDQSYQNDQLLYRDIIIVNPSTFIEFSCL